MNLLVFSLTAVLAAVVFTKSVITEMIVSVGVLVCYLTVAKIRFQVGLQ